jgi:hypothetical protein
VSCCLHLFSLSLSLSFSWASVTIGYIVGFNSAALGLAGVSEWAGGFHACCFLCTCNGYFLHWHWVWRSSPQRFWLILINSTGWESPHIEEDYYLSHHIISYHIYIQVRNSIQSTTQSHFQNQHTTFASQNSRKLYPAIHNASRESLPKGTSVPQYLSRPALLYLP